MAFDIEMIRKVYAELPSKIAAARKLLNHPLTLTEKILYAHLHADQKAENFQRGKSYVDFAPDRVPSMSQTFKTIVLSLGCVIWCLTLNAQLNYDFTAGKFLIKGKVVDLQTKKPIPLANVIVTNTGRGVSCDNDGNFSMYVSRRDTLKFSSTGFLPKVLHVYDLDSATFYTLEVALYHDVIRIREVNIYPYQDLDAFKKAFVDAKEVNKVHIVGIAPPKYSNKEVKAKFANPISLLYDRLKHRSNANPDFKP